MARLYADENFHFAVVLSLLKLGHDVLTIAEAGYANQKIPDETVLDFAIKNRRAILTYNRQHFKRLHHLFPNHAGIIICTKDFDTERQAERIHQAIADNEPLLGKLVRVNRPRI